MEDFVDLKYTKNFYYNQIKNESKYFLENVKASKFQDEYRSYLSNLRGIDEDILKEFYMFYVLDGQAELDELIPSSHVREIMGIQSGYYVRQQGRFVFPILDMDSVVMGFIGYDYACNPKYKYLINNAFYSDRSRLLFNMQNLYYAYKEGVLIVEEGIFDSLRLNSIGLKNNVSLMGKKVTEFHRRIFNRFDLIIFITDNDEEGMNAARYWGNGINSKYAFIYISKKPVIKKKVVNGVFEEYETITKDIDDALRYEHKDFLNLYNRIIEDSKRPFFNSKTYYFT